MPPAMLVAPLKQPSSALQAKHAEFMKAASVMEGASRTIETTPRGIEQHVARNDRALLRWPVAYEHGQRPTK